MPRVHLGAGDLVAEGPNPTARILFFDAVARCVPEALRALAALRDLSDESQLHAWATRWGFTDDWMLRQARAHAGLWRDHPELVGRWQLFTTTMFWEPIVPAAPSAWKLTGGEPEADYRARIEAYIATLKSTPGITATPEKRRLEAHFEWLALDHVGRWTYRRLAQRYQHADGNPNESAISRAITDTAALVGLTLRPAPGRKFPQPHRS